jgi:orotidine-5'-phosphate decarboxylase
VEDLVLLFEPIVLAVDVDDHARPAVVQDSLHEYVCRVRLSRARLADQEPTTTERLHERDLDGVARLAIRTDLYRFFSHA